MQVLAAEYHAAVCLVLVLTTAANIYWESPSCFIDATARVTSFLTFRNCLENKSIL